MVEVEMKTVLEQLAQYKSVHLNKKNMQTHFIGIPLIILAITLLLSLHRMQLTISADLSLSYTPAMVVFALTLIYYLKLHFKLALAMLLYFTINLYIAELMSSIDQLFWLAIAIFVVGWILQFIGHYYEKAKPAFFDDLIGLIIGPFFLVAEVYFALGFEPKLNSDTTELAVQKRKLLENK